MLKKVIISTMTVLMLAGCSDATAEYKGDNPELFSVGDYKVTKKDLYDGMMSNNGASTAYSIAETAVLDKEAEITDEMIEKARGDLDFYKQLYGDNYESMLSSMNMTEDEYVEKQLTIGSRKQVLTDKYIDANYDALCEELKPVMAIIVPAETAEIADKAAMDIKAGMNIADVITKHELGGSAEAQLILGTNTEYSKSVLKAISSDDTTGKWIKIENVGQMSPAYYIVKAEKLDYEKDKTQIVEGFKADMQMADKAEAYFMKQYGFKVYDVNLKNALESEYSFLSLGF